MTILIRAAAMIFTASLLLGGCAAPRTAQDDSGVRSVGVISLLNESTPIRHFGLTVFNNHPGTVEQGGKLKRVVDETVTQRLKTSRSQWTVKGDDTDLSALLDKNRKPTAGGAFATNYASDLAAIARRLDVDLLFVLIDSNSDNHPGQGVGITFRAVGNEPGTVMAHSFITLVVTDRNGKELVRRGAINGNPQSVPNSGLGLRSDMSTLNDPKVRENVSLTLQNRLKGAVEESMARAGY